MRYRESRPGTGWAPVLIGFLLGMSPGPAPAQVADPLAAWNEGPAKRAILDFVKRTTTSGGPDYVAPEARIAVFDNDGTLWPEKPMVEGLFVLDRIRALARKDPSLKFKEPYQAALAGDTAYFREAGEEAIVKLLAASHAGMSQEEFAASVDSFSRKAAYPKAGLPVRQIAYQPMTQLMAYLRSMGFQTWICSGGTEDFMRAFSLPLYGVPPNQVIGSEVNLSYKEVDGKGFLMRQPGLAVVNDKEAKPVSIARHIGLRPIFAAGNIRSGGDIPMLAYSRGGMAPSFQMLISHDDDKREFAYQEYDRASLTEAQSRGWTVVSMKRDWKRVFNIASETEKVGFKIEED